MTKSIPAAGQLEAKLQSNNKLRSKCGTSKHGTSTIGDPIVKVNTSVCLCLSACVDAAIESN